MDAAKEDLAPVRMEIQPWISSARSQFSRDEYVKHVVNLSWLLAERLGQLIPAQDDEEDLSRLLSGEKIKLREIAAQNVTIVVKDAQSIDSIRSIQFGTSQDSFGDLLGSIEGMAGDPPLSWRAPEVCRALGKILLELFSMGQINNTLDITFLMALTGDNSGSRENGDFPMPRGNKRTASSANACSKSSQAKTVLETLDIPTSIHCLVCDLLDAGEEHVANSTTAITSLEEVLWDLNQMKKDPEHFLYDRVDPQKALEDACILSGTDRHLLGRENELSILMNSVADVAAHVRDLQTSAANRGMSPGASGFLCNANFLCGYPGSGKSSIMKNVIHACASDGWFVIDCKFSKHIPSERALANAFNDFFGQWMQHCQSLGINSSSMESFNKACVSIIQTVDEAGFDQLRDLMPIFAMAHPPSKKSGQSGQVGISSSSDKVGAARKRLVNLFHIIFRSLCESGCPVLVSLDDMQWCDPFIIESITELFSYGNANDISSTSHDGPWNKGMIMMGSFRSNELNDDIIKGMAAIECSANVVTTTLTIGELTRDHLAQLISNKLCLPRRYTRQLARTVHSKTRGNPFFFIQFLRSIIEQNKMLEFSVRARRWVWDDDAVDKLTISEGVAELLTMTFSQLPSELMQLMKVVSCLGSHVDESTIDLINNGNQVLPFDMHGPLDQALKEGILEKSGTVYQFTHDIIQTTIYNLMIPTSEHKFQHITIGTTLLGQADDDPKVYCLAVDQINHYIKENTLSPEEKSQYASVNATAAKFALAASSFQQARSYIDFGMELLDSGHWLKQYALSLELYEMSASVCFMNGDTGTLSRHLEEITRNVKSFKDSLKARTLLAKLFAASSKYTAALDGCLYVLQTLGEEFPNDIGLPAVLDELSVMKSSLEHINSVEKVNLFPLMANKSKLICMQFLSMMSTYCVISKPMMLPLVSARMVSITIAHGFCDDSIVGIVTSGWSLFTFSNDALLGHQLIKVGKALIEQSPNKNTLHARLCGYIGWLQVVVEPAQSVVGHFADQYNAGMTVGDIESAMLSRFSYCAASFHVGVDLVAVSKHCVGLIQQAVKYNQNTVIYPTMPILRACISLTGNIPKEANTLDIKSFEDLNDIGQRTSNLHLLYENMLGEVESNFWNRNFARVAELIEASRPGKKRISEILFFFNGIASMWMIRQQCKNPLSQWSPTGQLEWRAIGEASLAKMLEMKAISKWNYENKYRLLQAEQYYTNGNIKLAEECYKASIDSAKAHRFIHEEALAYELYGICLLETDRLMKGLEKLELARDKYIMWGATKKGASVKDYKDAASLGKLKLRTPSPASP